MAIAEADGSPEALAELLKRFLLSCKLNENLDSWIPLSSDAVRLFFACLFLGLAEQLAKNVGCPKDKVRLQLSFACSETDIFSNLSGITTSRLITKLPDFGSSDRYTREYLGAAYKAGALSADVWLKAGISSDPSTQVVAFFKRWVNREASAEILNPQDIFKQLKDVFPFESNKSTDIEFFRRNKPLFRKVIFRYYPLDIGLISQFVGILGLLNWDEISENVNIVWSDDLIESFDLRIEWEILSGNPSISWSEQIIDRYRDKWDWMSLSSNRALPWNRDFVSRYQDDWFWRYLSMNHRLPLSIEFIEAFIDKWDWEALSYNTCLPWSESLIDRYGDRLDWKSLSMNQGLPWSDSFFQQHWAKWDMESLSMNPSVPWSHGFLESFGDGLNWKNLSGNTGLPWSLDLIEKYDTRWDWNVLSGNRALPWSTLLIERYESKWSWGVGKLLGMPSKLAWGSGLSGNRGIPWSRAMLELYSDKVDLDLLAEHYSANVESLPRAAAMHLLSEIG